MAAQQAAILGSVAGVGLLLGALILIGIVFIDPKLKENNPLAKTDCGDVKGTYDSTLKGYTFKGIPFAVPPTGNLRWKPPQAKSQRQGTCWKGTYDATKYASVCPQIEFESFQFTGSEDCLYLDIYTPSLKPDEKKPVIVYIHGGSLTGGNSHSANYAPTLEMAKEMDAVFVSIQYRLGALGFLVSNELKGRNGNYGLLDVIQSLKWIRNNIDAFGGDPTNVGVFGHSSGGTLVFGLMVTDLAKDLFHRAWASSASPVLRGTYEEAVQRNSFFAEKVNCANASVPEQCLIALSSEVVISSSFPELGQSQIYGIPMKDVYDIPFLVVDGKILKAGFLESFQRNLDSINDVPLMIGTTAQEVEFGPDLPESTPPTLSEWTTEIFQTAVRSALSTFSPSTATEALSMYRESDVTLAFTSLVSDVRVTCPNAVLARAAANVLLSPVYQYVVTQRPSVPAFGLMNYAFHTWDLFAFFDAMDVILYDMASEDDHSLVKIMQQQMGTFLISGKPNDPQWLPVPINTALIDKNITLTTAYNERKCNFWNNNGFYQYGSVN